jgi:hypothetical protein
MQFPRTLKVIAVTSLFFVAACDMSQFNQKKEDTANTPPRTGSLTQNLNMVDSTGRIYGTVQLDPINGGKIFDADGRLIGRVVNPVPAPLAPGVQ